MRWGRGSIVDSPRAFSQRRAPLRCAHSDVSKGDSTWATTLIHTGGEGVCMWGGGHWESGASHRSSTSSTAVLLKSALSSANVSPPPTYIAVSERVNITRSVEHHART